jgi:Protein of unknown function (DUF1236)
MKAYVCCAALLLTLAAGSPVAIAASVEVEPFAPGEPVMLTDAQRAKIRRVIVAGHSANIPGGKERVISEPSKPAFAIESLPAAPSKDLAVGTAVPATVPLTPLPDSIAVEVPAVRHLSYALVNGRLLLIDPATSIVLSEIDR